MHKVNAMEVIDGDEYLYKGRTEIPNAVAIGWLGGGGFEPRACDAGLLNTLIAALKTHRVLETMGLHPCPICRARGPSCAGIQLGAAELWIESAEGRIFAAPDLIVHYIASHGYCPPPDFQSLILDTVGGLSRFLGAEDVDAIVEDALRRSA